MLLSGSTYRAFLSHNWGTDHQGRNNYQRVSRLNSDLQRVVLVTWCDEERMEGYTIDQMARGIHESACVICVCITRKYSMVGIEKVKKSALDKTKGFSYRPIVIYTML